MDNFNKQCKSKNCKHYIEWYCDVDTPDGWQPYPCVSCKLIGKSYDIDNVPDDCPKFEELINEKITIVSTPSGEDNFFYQLWMSINEE